MGCVWGSHFHNYISVALQIVDCKEFDDDVAAGKTRTDGFSSDPARVWLLCFFPKTQRERHSPIGKGPGKMHVQLHEFVYAAERSEVDFVNSQSERRQTERQQPRKARRRERREGRRALFKDAI